MPPSYVYEITNALDGTVYVGKTSDPIGRWRQHVQESKDPLHCAMHDDGDSNFTFKLVEQHASTKDALDAELSRIKERIARGLPTYNKPPSGSKPGPGRYQKRLDITAVDGIEVPQQAPARLRRRAWRVGWTKKVHRTADDRWKSAVHLRSGKRVCRFISTSKVPNRADAYAAFEQWANELLANET